MLEASKVTVGQKTFDLNYLGKKKKTNLRRKLLIELIQSKPAGTIIKIREFQEAGRFSTQANAYAFVKRMERDGVIMRYEGDKPKSHYYAVTGEVRQKQAPNGDHATATGLELDLTGVVANMNRLGLKFTITISNEAK